MRIVFRVDASDEIGIGHVTRCLTLATALRKRGYECIFVSREKPGDLISDTQEKGFNVRSLRSSSRVNNVDSRAFGELECSGFDWQNDAGESENVIRELEPDLLVVDHYGIDTRWEERLSKWCKKVMVIDDLADRAHACDVLIDQNLTLDKESRYLDIVPDRCLTLLGPSYAMLQTIYCDLHEVVSFRSNPVNRILIYFGGGRNRIGLTSSALKAAVAQGAGNITIDVVTDADCMGSPELQRLLSANNGIRVHSNLSTLAHLMMNADLAIGAAGSTSWERCCLGLPSLVFSIAPNQEPIAEGLDQFGAVVDLGKAGSQIDVHEVLVDELSQWIDGQSRDISTMSERAWTVTDGAGLDRVVNVLENMI